jgi:signal transduction histidine kinase
METLLEKTKTEKQIRMGYGIAFFLIFLAYFITFYANRKLLNESGRVNHSNQVIASVEALFSNLKDAETGARGYLITKNPEFLSTYYRGGKLTDSLYQNLLQLTTDNAGQQEVLRNLKINIDKKLSNISDALQIFERNNRVVTDSLTKMQDEAIRTMGRIRLAVTNFQRTEKELLLKRDSKLRKTFSGVTAVTIVSVALAFILIIFGFLTYIRENKARKEAVKKIVDYQQLLTKRIDELHKANTELIRIRSQEKFAATGRIARTIAHEVRNPLTNINLAVEQLNTEIAVHDDTSLMLFDMIKRNSTRINQLISDLLNSTKFSELNYEKISINDLLDETIKGAEDRITLGNVTVIKKYGENISDISVDKGKMKIAFLNIIINALEAMGNKSGSILRLQTTEEAPGQCKVVISDNGPGLDSDAAYRLFEPYFTSKPKGNGLGLTNTQNIILNHKGEIYAETTPGKGASFIILLSNPS